MRKILMALMTIAMCALLVSWCSAPESAPETIPAPTTGNPSEATAEDSAVVAEVPRPNRQEARSAPPRLPPSGSTPRVTLDRGPMRPDEDPQRYKDRVWFAERFDAFVREAGVSDAQQNALLLALYDHVMAMLPLWGPAADDLERGVEPTEEWRRRAFGTTSFDWVSTLHQILTPEQARIWYRHCAGCPTQLSLFLYDEPVLRLEGAP